MFKVGDACIGNDSGVTYIILSFKECGYKSSYCEEKAICAWSGEEVRCSGKLLYCIISDTGGSDPNELLTIKNVCQMRVRLKTEEKEETVP